MRVDGSQSRAAVCVTITRAVTLISFALFGVPPGLGLPPATAQQTPPAPQIWTVPEIGALPNDAASQQVRRGRDLITATYAHVGPEVADPAKREAITARTPLGRWGQPADVTGATLFLASPAAAFITGIILPVDGGYSIA